MTATTPPTPHQDCHGGHHHFEIYLSRVRHILDQVASGELGEARAIVQHSEYMTDLQMELIEAFVHRLGLVYTTKGLRSTVAAASAEEYPVPVLRDGTQPDAYVHPARHPATAHDGAGAPPTASSDDPCSPCLGIGLCASPGDPGCWHERTGGQA